MARHENCARGAVMKIGSWAGLLAAAALLAGCGDFWQAPGGNSSTSFTLTNSGAITISSGSTTGTSTITVTPGSSFTGTVTLTCAVTTAPSNATSPTCDLSSSSLTFSSTTAQTSTLTATTTSSTTTGIYDITVTGVSNSIAETTKVCVAVGVASSGCTTTASTSGDFYILNSTTISGYSIVSGTLTALTGSPTSLPGGVTPYSMAVDPTGSFLYVGTSGGIYLYKISTGGALTLDTNVLLSDGSSSALKVDSTGQWLLDASNTTGAPTLYAWPISKTNGESTLGNGVTVPGVLLVSGGNVAVGGMAISPDNKLVAVAAGSETQTFTFTSGTDFTGATNPISTTFDKRTATGVAVSVAFNPGTSCLFIGETGDFSTTNNSGGLRIIPIASDVLGTEPAASSTYPYPSGGTGPHAILATSNGYVYVANWVGTSSGNVTAFLLNASTPSLTLQSNAVATGTEPYSLAEDSTGNFVMTVNNQGSPNFNAFTFDATTTGLLDSSLTSTSTGTGPIAIVAVP
jgi:6-phosphogluconolactonase (cycloisomerase 2 family)